LKEIKSAGIDLFFQGSKGSEFFQGSKGFQSSRVPPDFRINFQGSQIKIPRTPLLRSSLFPTGNFAVERFELNHPLVQGNKWYKLKPNIKKCLDEGKETILSFGGAFSNHIHALAAAGYLLGIRTIGVIRGERPLVLSFTLREAEKFGMQLHFVTRSEYRRRYSPDYIVELQRLFGDFYAVPEGGSNYLGFYGAGEMLPQDAADFSHIVTATGSGGTVGGILLAADKMGLNGLQVLSVPVLKDFGYVMDSVKNFLENENSAGIKRLKVIEDYHFGGYAKFKPELLNFISEFQNIYPIKIDPVYTGKVFFAVSELSRKGYFNESDRVLVCHTGGLQGKVGFLERFPEYSFIS